MASRRPDLSVLVPSVNGLDDLTECLAALEANASPDLRLEILVVDRCGEALRQSVRRHFPDVTVLTAPPDTTIPDLRAIGFRHAHADSVAVIEDHVLVPTDWARQLLAALVGHDAVAGSVSNAATDSIVDCAAFLVEYSHLMPPDSVTDGQPLAGNNIVYRRSALDRYSGLLSSGRWENDLHDAMRRDGAALAYRPQINVRHKMHYRVVEYLGQRYLYARSYAGLRGSEMTRITRTLLTLGTLVLPAVLLARITRRVVSKRVHRAEFARALPLIVLFVCAWAAGEAVGYAAGPGDALSRVR